MNALTGFKFDNHVAHGAFVELGEGVGELLAHRNYGPQLRALIGQAMAAMPLLGLHMRFEGRINLQFQGDGPMKLLVAQIDNALNVRGMAKAPAELSGTFTEMLWDGILSLMIEPDVNSTIPPSQAVVLIEGDSLAQALEGYFDRSEQLPTMFRLVADGDRLRGFMLQRLPLEHAKGTQDDWEHLLTLAATLTDQELLEVSPERLLRRLFVEEDVQLFEPRPVHISCRCSRTSVGRMLQSLGRKEVESIIAEQGKVGVTCEFCGREHVFTPTDVAGLFANLVTPEKETRH